MKDFAHSFFVFAGQSLRRLLLMMFALPLVVLLVGGSFQPAKAAKHSIQSVQASPLTGYYKAGDQININVFFSIGNHVQVNLENINDNATYPYLTLNVNNDDVNPPHSAIYNPDLSTSAKLVFTYTVQDGDTATPLNYTNIDALKIPANSGTTITYSLSPLQDADLILPPPSDQLSLNGTSNIFIDTSAPTISSIFSSPNDALYRTGESIPITIKFNEPIYFKNNNPIPQLDLAISPSDGLAQYSSGNDPQNGTKQLIFIYNVKHNDTAKDLDYSNTTPLLNGDSIQDLAGNSLDLSSLPVAGSPGSLHDSQVDIDATEPLVDSVRSDTPDDWYTSGTDIDVFVKFDEKIIVTGVPQLKIETGNTTHEYNANCMKDNTDTNEKTLKCRYSVQPGDASPHLDYIDTNPLILNGGTITDVDSNDANLALLPAPGSAGSLGANNNIGIDTQAPYILSITRDTPSNQYLQPSSNSTLTFRVKFNESVGYKTGLVDLNDFVIHPNQQGSTTTATIATIVPADTIPPNTEFTLTISGGDLMTFNGDVGIDLSNGAIIQDHAGNNIVSTMISTDDVYTLDSGVPAIPRILTPADQSYTNDSTPTITGTAEPDSTITIYIGDAGSYTILDNDIKADKQSGSWSYTTSALSDKTYTLKATATDNAGNTSADADSNHSPVSFTIDTHKPANVEIVGHPEHPFPTPSKDSNFKLSGTDSSPITFICWLTSPPPYNSPIPPVYANHSDCSTSSYQVVNVSDDLYQLDFIPELKDGVYELHFYAQDMAGNQSNTIEGLKEELWYLQQPPKLTSPSRPSFNPLQIFEFSSQNGVGFQCALDTSIYTSCSSPMVYFGISDLHYYGFHDFSVQTVYADGTTGGFKPFHWLFNDTKIDTTPAATTYSTSATFTFSTAYPDTNATFQCSLDKKDFGNCSDLKGSQTYPLLGLGPHTFQVRAVTPGIDTDGVSATITDPTPAEYSWTILAVPTPTPKQFISNGGFNIFAGTSKIPTGWVAGNFGISDGKNTSAKKEGIASVRIAGSPGKIKTLTQTILKSGVGGDSFNFSFWVRGASIPNAGLCQAQVMLYNGPTLKLTKTILCKTGTYTVFEKKSVDFTAISAYTKIVVKFIYSKASGTVWFDLASLLKK